MTNPKITSKEALEKEIGKILDHFANYIEFGDSSVYNTADYTKTTASIMSLISDYEEGIVKELKKALPKELGFEDYGKHIHTYVHENSGYCGICKLSWKKAGQYEIYNNAIIRCRKSIQGYLTTHPKEVADKKGEE